MSVKAQLPGLVIEEGFTWLVRQTSPRALICVLLWLAAFPALARADEKKPASTAASTKADAKPSTEGSSEKSGVALSGQISEEFAGPRGLIPFWITIENSTDADLSSIQLKDPELVGFRLRRLCWPGILNQPCKDIPTTLDTAASASQTPTAAGKIMNFFHLTGLVGWFCNCFLPAPSLVPPEDRYDLADSLKPQQSVTVWGYLEAVRSAPAQTAFVSLNWKTARVGTAAVSSSKTVSLGEVESLNCLRALALSIIHGWEWSFPLAGLLGGSLYKLWLDSREKKRKAKAAARAKAEHHRDELRDHQKRTWNLMLPRSQQAALRFYTPLAGAAQIARDQLRTYKATSAIGDLQAACYEILLFHWRLRLAIDNIGGYYFKNRDAEQLVDLVYRKHRFLLGLNSAANRKLVSAAVDDIEPIFPTYQFQLGLTDVANGKNVAGAVDEVKPNTTIGRFLAQQADANSNSGKFWAYFQTWASTSPDHLVQDIDVLDAYAAVLEYESNRPSLHWYGKLEPIHFTLPNARAVITDWEPWKTPDRLNLSAQDVTRYTTKAAEYLTEVERTLDATVREEVQDQ